jgi:hypothetical protein
MEPPAGFYKQRLTYFVCPFCRHAATRAYVKAGETVPRYWCPNCRKFSVLSHWFGVMVARALVFPFSFAVLTWGPFRSLFYSGSKIESSHFWILAALTFLLAFALSPFVARLVCRYEPAKDVP